MTRRIFCLLLCAALLLSLLGCAKAPTPTETTAAPETVPPSTAAPEPDALERYEKALAELKQKDDVYLTVTATATREVAGVSLTEESTQRITYNGLNSDDLLATVSDTTVASDAKIYTDVVYSQGKCYVTVDGNSFYSEIDQTDFLDAQYPLALIDRELYADVQEDGDTILFTGAEALEAWLDSPAITFQNSSATVTLDGDSLVAVEYSASFLQGTIPCTIEARMEYRKEIIALDRAKLVPEDTEKYVFTDIYQLPTIFREACVNLFSIKTLSFSLSENVVMQAAGAQFISTNDTSVYGSESFSMHSKLENIIYTQNGTLSSTGEESYIDGIYTLTQTIDGEETTDTNSLPASDLRDGVNTILAAPFSDLRDFTELTFRYVNGYYLISFTGNDDLADYLQRIAAQRYLNNEFLLSNLADDFRVDRAEGYLSIDPCTMLPVAYNVCFEGAHTIQGSEYYISVDFSVSMSYDPLTIYHEIFDEMPEEPAPETDPTPVFYKVTDTEGHTLWLLGTIHVGDVRTDHLPAAIYDAFDSADALAVEFDGDAFFDLVEEDPELQSVISEAYYYSDGTTLADHLDEETYEATVTSMQATGTYGIMANYYKPWMLESLISNAMLDTGYTLNSLHGVDEMLMRRARQQGKEIRDVESGEFQIRMFADTADDMQQFILEGTLWSDKIETVLGTLELYELWCSGDEAALIENLNEEPDFSEATEEEIALYKEYNDILLISRNHGMHDVAVSYLESGDTVFYAVGLAHLLGEDGLVGSLRDAGYTVELIKY